MLVALSKVDVTSSMFSVEFVCLRDSGRYKAGHSWMYTIEGEEWLRLDTSARYGWARQEITRANSFLECRVVWRGSHARVAAARLHACFAVAARAALGLARSAVPSQRDAGSGSNAALDYYHYQMDLSSFFECGRPAARPCPDARECGSAALKRREGWGCRCGGVEGSGGRYSVLWPVT